MSEIGHINIFGQIGSTPDANQQIESKGVELIDIVEQVANFDDTIENIHVHINSPGGYVNVGDDIAEFISSLSQNVYTIAEEQCASIATKIHLCVPVENRYVQSNCDYMIHNPFVQNVTGDGDELMKMGKDTKKVEEELESMYAKCTGLDKTAVSGLMKITTGLTPEQCVSFGFASKIINKAPVLALIYNEKDKPIMEKVKKNRILALVAKIAKTDNSTIPVAMAHASCVFALAHPLNSSRNSTVALSIETDKGVAETPFMDIMVGDPFMIEGEPAADDEYVLTVGGVEVLGESEKAGEGSKITVTGGLISAIEIEGGAPVEDNIETLKAQLVTETAKSLALTTANAALTTQNATLTGNLAQSNADADTILKELEAKGIKMSGYVPPIENNFNKVKPDLTGKSMKEQMAEAKAKYDKK